MEDALFVFILFLTLLFGFGLGQSSMDDKLNEALRVNHAITVQEFMDAYKIEVKK